MATISGKFVDETTGNALSDVVMDVWPTGDMSGTPIASFQSNDDGTFNITSAYFDTTGCTISVNYPGYYETLGTPGLFQGTVSLNPTQATQIVSSVPAWVWYVVALVAIYLIYLFVIKGKKLPI